MRLSHKLALALTCAILTVLAVNALIRVQREIGLFDDDMRKDSHLLGRAVAGAAGRIWRRVGEAEAIDVVKDANEREAHVQIRWVSLDAPAGHPHAASVPVPPLVGPDRVGVVTARPAGAADDVLYTFVAVEGPGAERVAIELGESLEAEHAYVRATVRQALAATGILVLVCAALIVGLGTLLVGRPVRQLVLHARRIGQGDLTSRLRLRQRDEIGELGAEMNAMSEQLVEARAELERASDARLAAIEQLRHADRLATVGKLSAGIAHEIGTPLNVITGYAELVAELHPEPDPAHEAATTISAQAHRVAAIVRQLLDFARPRPPVTAALELGEVAQQAATFLEPLARKRAIALELAPAADGVVGKVDGGQLQQVLTNLVVNAIHASPDGATITIATERRAATPPSDHGGPPGPYACVRVRDRGAGVAPELLGRIFEPFFTTKDVGEGTGLGLSVAYGIVKEHGGWITVEATPGGGTTFTIYLPLAEAP
ncbi:MAG: HAMP domain-containing protein [Myxococcales bacterium]|nr:HAMP domain-containing protein [Myxococcales bacterium]